jgi:fumarate reductase subunit C
MNREHDASQPRRAGYIRPMAGWWRRNPSFKRYMLREATAVGVALYALVLTVGVIRLAQGEAAWNDWRALMATPWSIALHLVLLVSMFIHARSWFEIMPKTMPMIIIGHQRLAASVITRTGWAVTLLASVLVVLLALQVPS